MAFPERASVKTAVNALSGSDVRTFADVTGEMEVFDISVAAHSPVAGQRLGEVELPAGSLVISGAGRERTATPETRLEAGERYIIAADPDASDAAILIQRENPALSAKDECSDALSEPRTEQGGSESRKLW